jgi:F0F1-type ATP synthase delta subunit
MKRDTARVADALVEICQTLPESEVPMVVEAALARLDAQAMRAFPRLVNHALVMRGLSPITLTVPREDSDAGEKPLVTALRSALTKKLESRRIVDPHMIGGVRVNVGDDRYDYSLRGALDHFAESLSSH